LAIFNNADSLAALKAVWPGTTTISELVTTRDYAVATFFAPRHVQVTPLEEGEGSRMLLNAVRQEDASPSDFEYAIAISRKFGGLPLALTQIGGFIAQRKLSLLDFLPLTIRTVFL